jgi:hypothetical protein
MTAVVLLQKSMTRRLWRIEAGVGTDAAAGAGCGSDHSRAFAEADMTSGGCTGMRQAALGRTKTNNFPFQTPALTSSAIRNIGMLIETDCPDSNEGPLTDLDCIVIADGAVRRRSSSHHV